MIDSVKELLSIESKLIIKIDSNKNLDKHFYKYK